MNSSLKWLALVGCFFAVAVVGYFDFVSGYENSMVLFYLAPIAVATWISGIAAGIALSVFSSGAWIASDVAAGIPRLHIWNIAMGLAAYVVFVVILSLLRRALAETQARVEQRTAALQRELKERKRLEKEIVAAAEHERQRVGRELHDNLSQHLTGTSLFARRVANKAETIDEGLAEEARKVVDLINRGINLSRDVARGLFSSELDAHGLVPALHSLASSASQQYGISYEVRQATETQVGREVAAHLYWIANEAVTNAGKHARARRVTIRLHAEDSKVHLEVEDDGNGLPADHSTRPGIGLRVMQQRAQLAGGELRIANSSAGGTLVSCHVPVGEYNGDE